MDDLKTKLKIIDRIGLCAESDSYVYIDTDGKTSNLHGNFSDKAALAFLKHIAEERPAAYRKFRQWKPNTPQ